MTIKVLKGLMTLSQELTVGVCLFVHCCVEVHTSMLMQISGLYLNVPVRIIYSALIQGRLFFSFLPCWVSQ